MTPDPYIDPFLPGRECMTQEKQGWRNARLQLEILVGK